MVVSFIPFIFTPKIGEYVQFDEHIFQMGWFNHQLDEIGRSYIYTIYTHLHGDSSICDQALKSLVPGFVVQPFGDLMCNGLVRLNRFGAWLEALFTYICICVVLNDCWINDEDHWMYNPLLKKHMSVSGMK